MTEFRCEQIQQLPTQKGCCYRKKYCIQKWKKNAFIAHS